MLLVLFPSFIFVLLLRYRIYKRKKSTPYSEENRTRSLMSNASCASRRKVFNYSAISCYHLKKKSERNILLLLSIGCHCYIPILINLTTGKTRYPTKAVLEVPWGEKKKMKTKRISSHIDLELAV